MGRRALSAGSVVLLAVAGAATVAHLGGETDRGLRSRAAVAPSVRTASDPEPHSAHGSSQVREDSEVRILRTIRGPDFAAHRFGQPGRLDPEHEMLRRLCVQEDTSVVVDEVEARARVRSSDVVLVGEDHRLEPCRRAFARIVVDLADPAARAESRVAMAFEAIPCEWQHRIDLLRREEGWAESAALREMIRSGWGWSGHEYATILATPGLERVDVIAAGGHGAPERRPSRPPDSHDHSWETKHCNRVAADAICDWLDAHPGGARQVFVLYGRKHLESGTDMREEIRGRGYSVVGLVPLRPTWEVAIRRRPTPDAAARWYEPAPGLFRAPYVTADDVRGLEVPGWGVPPELLDHGARRTLLAEGAWRVWFEALGSEEWSLRREAMQHLSQARSWEGDLVPALASRALRRDRPGWSESLEALLAIAQVSDPAQALLADLLRTEPGLRRRILGAASSFDSPPFLTAVRERVHDARESRSVRGAATLHLALRFAYPAETVPALIDLVSDCDGYELTAAKAALLLGRHGARAHAALPALRDAEDSWEPGLRAAARVAVAAIEAEAGS